MVLVKTQILYPAISDTFKKLFPDNEFSFGNN